ncbi:hypothetical protein PVIIG_06129 [Plasmodium vivax India VII]|uniref:Variable surface protein n=1 Tax=Plasmodium vivax India VII TaxID=1077284 RepID=A0A0J9SKA2_PLAVI|nr:hypothetical protein PVIIG_06129 [Plasmodium vivax India VII]
MALKLNTNMGMQTNYKNNKKLKLGFIIKLITFIHFIWIHYDYNNVNNISKYLINECNIVKTSSILFHRVLAKRMAKREFHQAELRKKLSNYPESLKIDNLEEDISTYTQLKRRGLNNFDLYMKLYKHRYDKKKGLAKIDCYFEKKVFDLIENIGKLAKKYKNNKKSFKKGFYKKYGIRLILFSLIPFIGLISPLLFNEYYYVVSIIMYEAEDPKFERGEWARVKHPVTCEISEGYRAHINEQTWWIIDGLIKTFLYISIIVVLIVVVYILIKTIKYERIKAGKNKMSIKEYFSLCKNVY